MLGWLRSISGVLLLFVGARFLAYAFGLKMDATIGLGVAIIGLALMLLFKR